MCLRRDENGRPTRERVSGSGVEIGYKHIVCFLRCDAISMVCLCYHTSLLPVCFMPLSDGTGEACFRFRKSASVHAECVAHCWERSVNSDIEI